MFCVCRLILFPGLLQLPRHADDHEEFLRLPSECLGSARRGPNPPTGVGAIPGIVCTASSHSVVECMVSSRTCGSHYGIQYILQHVVKISANLEMVEWQGHPSHGGNEAEIFIIAI